MLHTTSLLCATVTVPAALAGAASGDEAAVLEARLKASSEAAAEAHKAVAAAQRRGSLRSMQQVLRQWEHRTQWRVVVEWRLGMAGQMRGAVDKLDEAVNASVSGEEAAAMRKLLGEAEEKLAAYSRESNAKIAALEEALEEKKSKDEPAVQQGEPSEQMAEVQALLREVKQRSALRVLGAVVQVWADAELFEAPTLLKAVSKCLFVFEPDPLPLPEQLSQQMLRQGPSQPRALIGGKGLGPGWLRV